MFSASTIYTCSESKSLIRFFLSILFSWKVFLHDRHTVVQLWTMKNLKLIVKFSNGSNIKSIKISSQYNFQKLSMLISFWFITLILIITKQNLSQMKRSLKASDLYRRFEIFIWHGICFNTINYLKECHLLSVITKRLQSISVPLISETLSTMPS